MPFKPGHKKVPGSGMKKGQVTKDRQMLLDKAKELGVDPFEILLRFAAGDWEGLGYENKGQTIFTAGGGSFWKDHIEPELRQKSAADACQYMLPKLKSVDVALTDLPKKGITVTFNLAGADARKPELTGPDEATASPPPVS